MARKHYYLVRPPGQPDVIRTEQADGPRMACMLAYGVIYDHRGEEGEYKDIGTRAPRNATARQKAAWFGPDGWTAIPRTGN
jgi:hypothetical protein